MLKIGEFARLSNITVKALRYYDRLGLLSPVEVDESSGYRYYVVEQLARAHSIIALKALGLTLEQTGRLIDDEVAPDEMRTMLRAQQQRIRQEVAAARQQLVMVEFRLGMIEAEVEFPELDVVVKPLESLRFLTYEVPNHPSPEVAMQSMELVAGRLNDAIHTGAIRSTGSVFDVFHGETILPFESPELDHGQHEVWVGVDSEQKPISLEDLGRLDVSEKPAVASAATTVIARSGSERPGYETVALLRRWTVAQGYRPADHVRHLHHRGPLQTLDRNDYVVEAQIPLRDGLDPP